jgi:predicted phosphodiesterase
MKKLFCVLTCLALFATCDDSPKDPGSSDGEPSVIFGVMSDTHVGAPALSGLTPEARLQKAYEQFTSKNPKLDVIITVGDFSDDGKLESYTTYKDIMDKYSTAKNNLLLMGNHDNFESKGDAAVQQFKSVFGFEPTKDTVINGYHFITVSTRDGLYNTKSFSDHKDWLEERLAAANAENPRKPVFVFIHHTMAKASVIGSRQAEARDEGDLYDVFKKYPQVVAFSGHSHVPVADPRNIWQGDYTALNCGSVLYTALDCTHNLTKGLTANALVVKDPDIEYEVQAPNNRGESSTALIVEVTGTVVTVRRIDNFWNIEIPTKFVFDTSKPKTEFPYLEENRVRASVPPAFASGAAIKIDKTMDDGIEFTFSQAQTNNKTMPDDGAFTYEVSIKEARTDKETDSFLLQANYFMFPRPETVSHNTNKLDADSHYKMSVTPVGYFGKKGTSLTISFQTAKKGEGAKPDVYPIPIAMFPGANQLPPTGVTMDIFIGMLTGGAFNLSIVNQMFGGAIFYKDNELKEPFTGNDMINSSTIIYSTMSPETLLSLIGQ